MTLCILGLVLSCLILTTPARAETVSCTNSDGVLHVADDLMSLPEECRDQAKTLTPSDSGSVNYVPTESGTKSGKSDFNRAVRDEEQAQAKKRRESASYVRRAESIANAYQNAVVTRKSAVRSKKYGTRDSIQQADAIMQRSRSDKQALLSEVESARITSEDRQRVEAFLDKVD